jgi:PAS domain S-box-containing protein
MAVRDYLDYGHGLVVVSGLLLTVPLFDMYEDVFVEGKTPLSTILENSIFVALTLALLGASVWLLRNDWADRYVETTGRWSLLGTIGVAVVYGWVLAFQLVFQNDLKPFIIAADGVVIGGIALFVAGVYHARSRQEQAELEVERDRFSALFDNTTDAITTVRFDGDTAVCTDANTAFETTFECDRTEIRGRSVVEVLHERSLNVPATTLDTVVGDADARTELRRDTHDGIHDFLVEYVPIGSETGGETRPDGFVVCTDITAQKERERQFETLSEGTEGLLTARSVEDVVGAVRTLTTDLFEDGVGSVWRYDAESGDYRPLMTTTGPSLPDVDEMEPIAASPDGSVDDGSTTDGSVDDGSTTDGRGATASDADDGSASEETVPAFETDAFERALADRGVAVAQTRVASLTDPYRLVLGHRSRGSATEQYLFDVLAANARAAIGSVERRETLTRRNDQLEFVNSLLRHDVQNAMTIVRARGQVLAESLAGTHGEYADTIVEQSDDVIDIVDRFRVLLDALSESREASLSAVSLSATLRARVGTLETTYPDADVTCEVPDGIEVVADEMLENVLGNVLTNAVEHNDSADPVVAVTATEHERAATVRIADNGPGIPDDKKDTVFRRGNRGLEDADIGSGFGLFFVETMVERYGGEVSVEDNTPDGAVFVITLPTVR